MSTYAEAKQAVDQVDLRYAQIMSDFRVRKKEFEFSLSPTLTPRERRKAVNTWVTLYEEEHPQFKTDQKENWGMAGDAHRHLYSLRKKNG